MKPQSIDEWSRFIDLFLERNSGRPTRLGVFVEEARGTQDFWVEDGLPLNSVTVEPGTSSADVEMMFGDKSDSDKKAFTHIIKGARSIRFGLGFGNTDDVLEITDLKGRTTVLRFENFEV
jgi:hypothetical protein